VGPITTGKVKLRISGVSANAPPAFVYGIYLNLPEGNPSVEQQRLHYAGTLDFFSKIAYSPKDHDHGNGSSFSETFDVTAIVAMLQQSRRWQPEKLTITFQPLTPIASQGNEEALRQRLEASAKQAAVTCHYAELLLSP
jgi:hypothetical protein